MSTDAIVMMIVAMLVVWGGLGLAIANVMRDNPSTLDDTPQRDL